MENRGVFDGAGGARHLLRLEPAGARLWSRRRLLRRGDHGGRAGLVEDGLMLEEDVERAAATAANWGRPRHEIGLK